MGKKTSAICGTLFWILTKSTFIHIVLLFTLVPHIYYLAKIYIKIILYE